MDSITEKPATENPKYLEIKEIFSKTLENIEAAIESIKNPEFKTKNKAEFSKVVKNKELLMNTLLKTLKNKRVQTDSGRIYYTELFNNFKRLSRNSRNIIDFHKLWVEIDDLFDYVDLVHKKVCRIPYRHMGITIMGFGIIIIPFYNIISIAIGGYLLYAGDYRSKVAGGLMLLALAMYLIVIRVLMI